MNILMIGDVVGSNGCAALRRHLPQLKKLYGIDLTIVNGENSAEGNGIMPASLEHIVQSGADIVTTGNHVFRRREIMKTLDDCEHLLRPANYPNKAPGHGMYLADLGRMQVAVINLMGVVYLDALDNPFEVADSLVAQAKAAGARIVVLDFHAEATAEKRAMGYYLDGRISILAGTHTHVQTSDETILPQGTGYITDLGMTGPLQSVLGVKPELAIRKMKDKLPVRFENAQGESVLSGCVFEVDEKTGKTLQVQRLLITG